VLDLKTLGNQLVADRASRGRPGVSIDVPYRTAQFGKLEPFTVERERAALDQMAVEIPYTLVKLAQPGDARSLNRLVIAAERSKRHISWRQNAETLRSRIKGVTGIKRRVRLGENTDDGSSATSRFTEIEFRRRIAIPQEFSGVEFPSYYRSPQNYCYIGISVSTKRDHIDLTHRVASIIHSLVGLGVPALRSA
jgi:hypothetical protein